VNLIFDSVEVDWLAGGEELEKLERLIELGCAILWIDLLSEGAELLPSIVAKAHSNDEPTRGETIQGCNLSGQNPGSASRQRCDHGTNVKHFGCTRDGGHGDPGISDGKPWFTQNVIPKKDAVPASTLCPAG
jgi:hypothetical protein